MNENYNAVLLEQLKSQMDLVIEGMHGTKESLTRRMDGFEERVNERFDILEAVVRGHSAELQEIRSDMSGVKSEIHGLKSDMGGMKSEVHGLKSDMKSMEERLSDKIDRIGVNHEERISALEAERL